MKRRSFLTTSVTASLLAGGETLPLRAAGQEGRRGEREYYELRVYYVLRGRQHNAFSEFLQKAWLPAMNRMGIAPIGVFEVMVGPENPSIHLLIPLKSLETLASMEALLAADAEFQTIGASVINAPSTDPAYVRAESSLMVAFEALPHLQTPSFGKGQAGRFFELRTYESHSKKANRKKIEMFNTSEIAIFHRTGTPAGVFWRDPCRAETASAYLHAGV